MDKDTNPVAKVKEVARIILHFNAIRLNNWRFLFTAIFLFQWYYFGKYLSCL